MCKSALWRILYLLYATTKAYTIDEFSEHFAQLNNNYPEALHVLENVFGFEKWSRAHFLGNRYDGMTTNIDESLNSVLMDEREYPLSHIFNSIARKLSEKFRERHIFVDAKNNKFMPCAERILRDNKSGSDSLYVTNANGGLNQFTVFSNGVTAKINLLKRSCSCRKFDLVKMSCEHVMASLRAKYGDDVGYRNTIYEYSSLIYKSETYLLMYYKVINVVPSETEWTVPQEVQDTKISPPPRIPNSKRRKPNTLRASMRYSSPNRNRAKTLLNCPFLEDNSGKASNGRP
ncbi:hypothetical protein BC332_29999 [Capsicum chinense]|nr:hypothetical protein BC332_29999 [Capsicum chinense]